MIYKKIVILIIIIFISGCSTLKNIIYTPDINQGNYIIPKKLEKIRVGMSHYQVKYILGTPITHNPFQVNIWYYVFYQKLNNKPIKQQTVKLIFNNNDQLISISNGR